MNIKELRAKLNLTQKEFGERIGMQQQTILKYERGERNIPLNVQLLIRYMFAEHLPEKERLYQNLDIQTEVEEIEELKKQNEQLLERIKELERREKGLEKDKEMLQLHIETLTRKQAEDHSNSKTA